MPFINEFISEQDIQAHRLDELMRSINPKKWRDGRPSVFTFSWTVDRETGDFLLPVRSIMRVGESGREEPTTKSIWMFNVGGHYVRLVLDHLAPGSSSVTTDNPYRIVWSLEDMDIEAVPGIRRDDLLARLKAALVAYGKMGAWLQVPNTQVDFLF